MYAIIGNLSCAVVTLLILYCNASLAQKITNQVHGRFTFIDKHALLL